MHVCSDKIQNQEYDTQKGIQLEYIVTFVNTHSMMYVIIVMYVHMWLVPCAHIVHLF